MAFLSGPPTGKLGEFIWWALPTWFRAWISGGMPVYLCDHKGNIYYTLAWPIGATNMYTLSMVYLGTLVGPRILHPDGTVNIIKGITLSEGTASIIKRINSEEVKVQYDNFDYIKYWLPVDKNKRVEMILKGATGFDICESNRVN